MPHLTQYITPEGPIVDVEVCASSFLAMILSGLNQQIPNPIRVNALIDTGASKTCVDLRIINLLNLFPTGRAQIITPSTGAKPMPCSLYDVSLVLLQPNGRKLLPLIPIIGCDFSTQNVQVLLGRDVLASCLFCYDGAFNIFSLAI